MAGRADEGQADRLDALRLVVDRHADVPVGAQIGWALQTRISDGTLRPGERLPGLRELADATGVNANTARSVYQRLEHAGLLDSRHGTGTFVAASARASELARVAASAAEEARAHGLSARQLAVALYGRPEPAPGGAEPEVERRQLLRRQITALETAIGELEARHGIAAPASVGPTRGAMPTPGPRLLGIAELEGVRTSVLRRLVALQGAIDGPEEDPGPRDGGPARASRASKATKPKAAKTAKPRRRPSRPGLAGA